MTKTLTIEFHGICVHFSRAANPSLNLPAAHRVVLPYLPDGLHWNQQKILVHRPVLAVMTPGGPLEMDPMNATLSLSTLTDKMSLTSTFQCQPNLLGILPGMTIDPAVVTGEAAPAAVYFDIDEGTMSGIEIRGSAGMRLAIETERSEVALKQKYWGGDSETVTMLPLPATIVLSNIAKDPESDLAADFIISFAVGKPFPPAPTPEFILALEAALAVTMICLPPSASMDLGPGCSNSQFP